MGMSSKLPYLVAAFCLYGLAAAIYWPLVADHPYPYDEADYMWAGKQGLWANYTDRNALSFFEFVRKGIELSQDPAKRASFSQFIRTSGDIGMYRHFHGPVYAYWLALLHDAGAVRENVFRGSGLLIHFATATLILLGFWAAFPSLPRLAGLIACALLVFNRTALTGAVGITQHVAFTFLCIATLFAASFFFRALEERWLYGTMALLALSFCAVETAALLAGALCLTLLLERGHLQKKWPSLKSFAVPLGKGIGVFVLAMLVCWPMGVLHLGIAKGFLMMAYFSLRRKTFSPFGTLDLWSSRFNASPWEYSFLVAGVIAAFVLWRRSAHRRELLPWLAFITFFLLATLKVTLPYTFYYAPLTAAFAVVTAAAFGMLWNRWPGPLRGVLLALAIASIVGTTVQYRQVAQEIHDSQPYHIAVLKLTREQPVPAGQRFYLPFQLVPTLHYYHPEVETAGYDVSYPIEQLAAEIVSPQAADVMLCEEALCAALEQQRPGILTEKTLLDRVGPNGQPFYVTRVRKGGV
jgi:hypothetical protein